MYVCHVTCMKKNSIGSIVKLVRWDSPSDSDCRYWTSIRTPTVFSKKLNKELHMLFFGDINDLNETKRS